MIDDLWLPEDTAFLQENVVGRNAETGGVITNHKAMCKYVDSYGRAHYQEVSVLATADTSKAEIEDMLGHARENFFEWARQRYSKPAATIDQKKEAGKSLEEIRIYGISRRESTNNKIYYKGTKE